MKATNRNKPKRAGTKLKRNRSLATSLKYPDRQNKRQRRNNHNNNNTTGNDPKSSNNENNEDSNEHEDGDEDNSNNKNNDNDDSNIANQNASRREQKAATAILPSWKQRKSRRQRDIEGSSERYPIDLVNSSNKELLEYIGTGGDDNNGDDDDGVVLVLTKHSLEDLSEHNSDSDTESAGNEPNRKIRRIGDAIVRSDTLKEISSLFRLRLYRNDLRSLVGKSWLNSKVMDCYNCLIEKDRQDLIILSVLVYTDISMLTPKAAVEKNKAMQSLKGIKALYVPMTLGKSAGGGGGSHHMLCTVDFTEKKVKIINTIMRFQITVPSDK